VLGAALRANVYEPFYAVIILQCLPFSLKAALLLVDSVDRVQASTAVLMMVILKLPVFGLKLTFLRCPCHAKNGLAA